MSREKSKWRPHKDPSTEAERRGGVMHSSNEGIVMMVERRHDLIQLAEGDNCEAG
ncbi:MAG: hypothetical protein IIB56_16105 [Planctomycetes bacterium]|nr:hypothetical protein [Planctomycetota bacterium]